MNVALEESVSTVGDPLPHVLGGSVAFDCILIPLLSCVCVSVLAMDLAGQMR